MEKETSPGVNPEKIPSRWEEVGRARKERELPDLRDMLKKVEDRIKYLKEEEINPEITIKELPKALEAEKSLKAKIEAYEQALGIRPEAAEEEREAA